ncbi:MAG: saccharopine dehydrogenase NADP-binding domain-containing protein, partial [Gammaproteobacteria bacterium]|nr:saccharopine dehydrogenase NADP-binding domain-containing protein [Gammaproteobacteria bacterium]
MSATQPKIMIYGANGYTGNLIAHLAKEQKLNTVLAGRNANAVNQMGESLGFACQVFGLDNIDEVVNQLKDIALVIHCAGPFSATAKPMMQACLQSQTHYTDITGEISVFELAHSLSKQAKQANVILCPGVGFDVIPTDCLASQLKEKMPDATHLAMAFDSAGKMSPGTAKTSVEGL